MAINHKQFAMAPSAMGLALAKLSKNALIDLVFDLAVKQVGEDNATDEAVADQITDWMSPIFAYRNDRRIDIRTEMQARRDDLARQEQTRRAHAAYRADAK